MIFQMVDLVSATCNCQHISINSWVFSVILGRGLLELIGISPAQNLRFSIIFQYTFLTIFLSLSLTWLSTKRGSGSFLLTIQMGRLYPNNVKKSRLDLLVAIFYRNQFWSLSRYLDESVIGGGMNTISGMLGGSMIAVYQFGGFYQFFYQIMLSSCCQFGYYSILSKAQSRIIFVWFSLMVWLFCKY